MYREEELTEEERLALERAIKEFEEGKFISGEDLEKLFDE